MIASIGAYIICLGVICVGFYTMIATNNYIKKIFGLSLFQLGIILFYIAIGKVRGGTAPIYSQQYEVYSNPLPHVLMLTAIVVGIATVALALALVIRIKRAYNTIEEDEISQIINNQEGN